MFGELQEYLGEGVVRKARGERPEASGKWVGLTVDIL